MTPENLAAAAFRLREIGILIALGVAVLFFSVRATNFLSVDNWQDIAKDVAIVVVVGIGETMVILTRNIDLSVASIVGLTRLRHGRHARGSQRTPRCPGRRAGDGGRPRLLGSGQRSPGHRRPRARDHRDAGHAGDLPGARVPGHRRRGDLRLPVARQLPDHRGIEAGRRCRRSLGSLLGVALVGAAILRWAPWARDFYAIGSNPDAARLAGIHTGRRVVMAFVMCGALSGLGGFMWAVALSNGRRRLGDRLRTRRRSPPSSSAASTSSADRAPCSGSSSALCSSRPSRTGSRSCISRSSGSSSSTASRSSSRSTIDALVTHRLQDALRRRRRAQVLATRHMEAEA